MSEYAERHAKVAADFSRLVAAVRAWDAPTPVEGWVARDVVGHLCSWFPALLESGAGITLPPFPDVTRDPAAAWAALTSHVQELLDERPEAPFSHQFIGDLPLAAMIDRFYTTDVFLHAWDLARASGLYPAWSEEECETLLAGMTPMEEVLRGSGHYGAARGPLGESPSARDRLVAFIGRDPQWRPETIAQ